MIHDEHWIGDLRWLFLSVNEACVRDQGWWVVRERGEVAGRRASVD